MQHLVLSAVTVKIVGSLRLRAAVGFAVADIIKRLIAIQCLLALFQINIRSVGVVFIAHIVAHIDIDAAKLVHRFAEAIEIQHGYIVDRHTQIFAHHRLHFILG
ncbi:hypothetical protein D3C73_1271840 [compost metagenome]